MPAPHSRGTMMHGKQSRKVTPRLIGSLVHQILKQEEEVSGKDHREVERDFEVMRKAYTEGKPRKKKKPWISKQLWRLVGQREATNKKILDSRSGRLKKKLRTKYVEENKEVIKSVRADKRRWLDNIASKAKEAAQRQHMKTLHGLAKTLCNERPKQSTAVLDKTRNLLSKKSETKERWTEHFKEELNRDTIGNPITISDDEGFDMEEVIQEIVVNEPPLGEEEEAVKKPRSRKAPGFDNIPAELLKTNVEFSARKIQELLLKVWKFEVIPEAWKRGRIIKLRRRAT